MRVAALVVGPQPPFGARVADGAGVALTGTRGGGSISPCRPIVWWLPVPIAVLVAGSATLPLLSVDGRGTTYARGWEIAAALAVAALIAIGGAIARTSDLGAALAGGAATSYLGIAATGGRAGHAVVETGERLGVVVITGRPSSSVWAPLPGVRRSRWSA